MRVFPWRRRPDAGSTRSPEAPAPARGPLDEAVTDAEHMLQQLAGDASLCAISRSGGPVDGVKYHEGRLAAAMEARRVVRRLEAAGEDTEIATVLATMRSTWADEHQRAIEDDRGRSWIAYRAGGIDQLDELQERLSG